jgi:hypothetical protein
MRACAALLFVLLPIEAASAADWIRVETHNFIVYGETGEQRVREVADEFERFREALARVIPAAGTPSAVPTAVVVFGSQAAFAPYRPRFNGKPIRLGGYFFASEDMNLVAFADVDRDQSLRTIFHEYVHLALTNVSQNLPVWLGEGLAEYYSTFQVLEDGRRAIVGRVVLSHLQLLGRQRMMTIPELLAVDGTSSDYNEGRRQSLFYAQSWALVHMLVSDDHGRTALGTYTNLVSKGVPSREAWAQVFDDDSVAKRLRRYVGQDVMKVVSYRFGSYIPRVKSDTSSVSPADAEAALADLLRRVAPAGETSVRFDAAIAVQPASARAKALYGLHALEQEDLSKARTLLVEASRDKRDWLVQYHVATGLTRLATGEREPEGDIVALARAALERVLTARPELPHALALAARLDAIDRRATPNALAGIRRARALSPGREDYALFEAYLLLRQGEFAQSRQVVNAVLATAPQENVRRSAQDLLRQVERAELEAANYLARLEGRRRGGSGSEAARPSPDTASEPLPVFRRLEAGEHRVEGRLERIACSGAGISLHIVMEDRTLERFEAASMDRIDFITYRDDVGGPITCGPRTPPERVYLTWRQLNGARRIVAVEFLPK